MRRSWVVSLTVVSLFVATSVWLSAASAGREVKPPAVTAKDFDPGNFSRSTNVDNPWLPMEPGTQLTFTGFSTEGKERFTHRVVFTVTDLTKTIAGVRTVVLWDRDFNAGQLVEAELAFFAQDDDGHVWQLGEYPEEYEEGKVVAHPAWIHGVKGARAGLTMRAAPSTGTASYSLGWGPAVGFNDRARILKLGQRTCVPVGCFAGVLVVDEYNPDEPGKHQLKYYARGVGNVRVGWAGAKEDQKETLVLTKVVRLGAGPMAAARAQALKLEKNAYRISKRVYGATARST